MQNDGQLPRNGDRVDAPLPAPSSSSSRRLLSGSGAPSPPRRACRTHHPIACPGNGAGDVLFTRLMFRRREPEIRPTIFDERKRPGLSTADLKVSAVSTPTPRRGHEQAAGRIFWPRSHCHPGNSRPTSPVGVACPLRHLSRIAAEGSGPRPARSRSTISATS